MAIHVTNLSFAYQQIPILKNINFKLEKGQFISLIGPNGCGKSTLLKNMLSLYSSHTGSCIIDNQCLKDMKSKERAKLVAFLPQSPEIHEHITVEELVKLGRYHNKRIFRSLDSEDIKAVQIAISWAGLDAVKKRSILSLSGGQRQRAFLAMILAQDTDYIFLDEPTSYLDVNHQIEFIELLKKLQKEFHKTIVIVLHDLPTVSKYSDYLVILKDGALYKAGEPKKVFTLKMLNDVFGVCANICPIKNSEHLLSYDYRKI